MLRRPLNAISVLICLTTVGCQQSSQPSIPPAQPQNAAAAPSKPTAEEAKAHVQKYIDQFLGGDASLKMKLLSLSGVDFDTVDSIDIVRSVPKFNADGKPLENGFAVVLKATGFDSLRKRMIEKTIDHLVYFKDGKWIIVGTDL